jgi:hypothetical protein
MQIRPLGVDLFNADGWTDGQKNMTKLTAAFRSFVNVPQKLFPYTELTECFFYWKQAVFSTKFELKCFYAHTVHFD